MASPQHGKIVPPSGTIACQVAFVGARPGWDVGAHTSSFLRPLRRFALATSRCEPGGVLCH